MKATQTILVLTILSCADLALASRNVPEEVKQKAALDTCLVEAKKRYGSVSESSDPTKKKIGKIRGHAYKLLVGSSPKRVNCIANTKGKSMFYNGRI